MLEQKAKTATQALKIFGQQTGQRITLPREYVLEIIAGADKPMTAYDVLDALGKKLDNPKPPTAYRALDFLAANGFVHRIESLNAYVACAEDHHHQGSQFMICDECGNVEEVHLCHMPEGLEKEAIQKGFRPAHWSLELHGRCGKCT